MFRPIVRFAKKKSRMKPHKVEGDFPLHRRVDYAYGPVAASRPSSTKIRDLDDPLLDVPVEGTSTSAGSSPPKRKFLKPHELYPKEGEYKGGNPGAPEHPNLTQSIEIPEVDVMDAVKKYHWMPHPKAKPKGDEYFSKYFFGRDRRLDAKEEELKKIKDEMPDSKKAKKRISPRKYWYSADYIAPTLEEIPHLNSCDIKGVMMEEAHAVRKGKPRDDDLWNALAQRGAEVASGRLLGGAAGPQCGSLTTLRMLQALASVQILVSAPVVQIVERATMEKRLKPHHHHFILQALSRLRFRDPRIFKVVEKMSLVWGMLPKKQLVRVANAVAKLDMGSAVWVKPLREILKTQLPNLGPLTQNLKAVTVIELMEAPELYLIEAFNQRQHIRYSRHLQLIELYVRMRREAQWEEVDIEVKEWLEMIRDEATDLIGAEKPSEPSELAASVANALRKSGRSEWGFEEGQRVGPYFSDMWLYKRKIIIEALCPYSYYVRTRQMTSTARMRLRFLTMMGFEVKEIPHYQWPSNLQEQIEYLHALLDT